MSSGGEQGLSGRKQLNQQDATSASRPPVSTSDLSGRQIGRYMLQQQIGSGGVATVYQAYDQVEGRSVALKVLLPTADSNTINRFRREALTAGALRHPNIVRIYQVGTALHGDVAYIAMELVEGESLSDWLARVGRLRPEESCNLLAPIAEALDHAHAAGVVHRDVKPSNILLRPASPGAPNSVQLESLDHPVVPLLTDFGVARAMDAPELTSTGRTVGTPSYMAPEQCAGNRVIDGRADLYALGTVLYRCVVGRLPFSGTTTQILHAHVYAPLTIDDVTLRQLPPVVVDILQRSLAKSPEERYADGGEMAAELAVAAGRRPLPDMEPLPPVPDSTATLTLSSLPAAQSPSTQQSTSVLVPAPGESTTTATIYTTAVHAPTQTRAAGAPPALPASARPERRSLASRLERFNWIGFSMVALMLMSVLFFAAVLATTLPDLVGERLGIGGAPISSPTPPSLAVVISPTANVIPAPPPPRRVGIEPGRIQEQPVDEPAALIVAAATATSTATSAPVPSSTLLPAPTATAAPTTEPTPLPTVAPEATLPPTDDAEQVFACTNIPDPLLVPFIAGLDSSIKPEFACPTTGAAVTEGQLLNFEYGYMINLANDPSTYVYYDISDEWERPVSGWTDGDLPRSFDDPPPNPSLYQPEGALGWLWENPQRRQQLGYATSPAPVSFRALEQKFPGGALVRDLDNGYTYLFLRQRLKL